MIIPFGDEALLVVLGEGIDPEVHRRVRALVTLVTRDAADGGSPWGSPVPAFDSVLVPYDALRLAPDEAVGRMGRLLAVEGREQPQRLDPAPARAPRSIEVRYGAEAGPDLSDVAERTGLTPAQVVEAHASVTYLVYFLGFVPGFAYMGIVPRELVLPRRDEPRVRVPAGSVGIAGEQTAVYPTPTPGGWHLIGRTPARLWDPHRDPPALLAPGDLVRFVPVDV